MQYIFGDNRTSYAVIYTDATPMEAQKTNNMLRFPITPNEKFNTLGFLTFGTNYNYPFFFCIRKDKSIPRSCYFTHGFTRDANPRYFEGEFLNDLFCEYISQEDFDVVRDGGTPGRLLTQNTAAAAAAASKAPVCRAVLREVIAQLYQKNRVLLTVDDALFNDDLVRAALRQIYSYLVPSVRKATSFLSAVAEVGSAEIGLRIVPRSMVENRREKYIDIQQADYVSEGSGVFYNLADMLLSEEKRAYAKVFFENFEYLYAGYENSYKKQNAEELFNVLMNNDLDHLEKIVDSFLQKHPQVADKAEMSSMAQALTRPFNDQTALEQRLVLKESESIRPQAWLAANNVFVHKLMLFGNNGPAFLGGHMALLCRDTTLSNANIGTAEEALKTVAAKLEDKNLKPYEHYFYSIMAQVYDKCLQPRVEIYREQTATVNKVVSAALAPLEPIEPSEFEEYKADIAGRAAAAIIPSRDPHLDLTNYINEVVMNQMTQHNEAYMTGAKTGTPRYPNEIVLTKLSEIEKAIQSGVENARIEAMIKETAPYQANFHFMIDGLIALYTVRAYQNGTPRLNFYRELGAQFRDDSVVKKIEMYDPAVAITFVFDVCADAARALEFALQCIDRNRAMIEKLDDAALTAFASRVCAAMDKPTEKAPKKASAAVASHMGRYSAQDKTYTVLNIMKTFCTTRKVTTVYDKKLATSKLLVFILAIVAVLAIAAAAFFAISDLFGKEEPTDDKPSSSSSTTVGGDVTTTTADGTTTTLDGDVTTTTGDGTTTTLDGDVTTTTADGTTTTLDGDVTTTTADGTTTTLDADATTTLGEDVTTTTGDDTITTLDGDVTTTTVNGETIPGEEEILGEDENVAA